MTEVFVVVATILGVIAALLIVGALLVVAAQLLIFVGTVLGLVGAFALYSGQRQRTLGAAVREIVSVGVAGCVLVAVLAGLVGIVVRPTLGALVDSGWTALTAP